MYEAEHTQDMSNFTMNTSARKMNDDGWETVGGGRQGGGGGGGSRWGSGWGSASSAFGSAGKPREMPAAFGGRDDPRKAERRAAAEAQAAREAAEAREKRAAEEKERKRMADATNFASTELYPALGGGGAPAAGSKPKPAMNFSRVVTEMAEREEVRRAEEEREAAAAAAAAARAREETAASRQLFYGHRTYEVQHFAYAGDDEDAPVDDYPDEESDYEEEAPPPADDEGDGEFNADIGSGRRRGDKGIW